MPDEHDIPHVIAPPPLLYLGGLVLGYILHRMHPLPIPGLSARAAYPIGLALMLAGIIVNGLGILEFRRARTDFIPTRPASALLSRGVFARTRNPLYLSMTLVYAGIAMLLHSGWVLLCLVPVLVVMHYGVILREERYLERRFGSAYLEYKARVRRWG